MVKINKSEYVIKETNYIAEVFDKNKIILCNSFSKNMEFANGWVLRQGGEYKNTTAFSIDRDGTIYQHFNPKYYAHIVSEGEINEESIGITLVNEGWLDMIESGELINIRGQKYESDEGFINQYWRAYNEWVTYTEEQYISLSELIMYLSKKYNIYSKVISHNTKIKNPNIMNGVLTRSNFDKESTDVSPAFDFNKLKNYINNEKEK